MKKKTEDYQENPEPSYYSGTKYGYSARKVVEDFDLSYNLYIKLMGVREQHFVYKLYE